MQTFNQNSIQTFKQILIGTSGYDHEELKGIFYPENLPRKDFLSYYSTQFNAVEINSTFYGMPTEQRIQSFLDRSEGRLYFSIKAFNLLTHNITGSWKTAAQDFKTALKPLQQTDKLSAVLFQFPESFRYTPGNRYYLSDLIKFFEGFPVAVEFRHREWIRQSVFQGLSSRNTSIVFCDMPQLKNLPDGFSSATPFTGSTAYIRFHGRNAAGWYTGGTSSHDTPRYDYLYTENELKSFVNIVNTAQNEGKRVQMYFNNHPKGNGIQNAIMMRDILLRSQAYNSN